MTEGGGKTDHAFNRLTQAGYQNGINLAFKFIRSFLRLGYLLAIKFAKSTKVGVLTFTAVGAASVAARLFKRHTSFDKGRRESFSHCECTNS